MLRRLASLRLWLLAAMVGTALVGLAVAYFAVGRVARAEERTADARKARDVAAAIAAQAAAGATPARFAAVQSVLRNDQVVVARHGRVVYAGPPLPGRPLEAAVSAPFAGGTVVVRDYASGTSEVPLQLVAVAAVLLLAVIAAAIGVASLLTRAIRRPLERATAAADAVASGDFTARMGAAAPEELARLGRAFDGMADRLERADRDQRQFLADVVHEIATPLNTLSGFALALADGTASSEQDRSEAAGLVARESERLQALLDDLRRLSHLDLAEAVRSEELRIEEVCVDLLARFAPVARAAGIDLRVRATDPVSIVADPRLLGLVLDNLVSNAIRYTPAGGRVDVEARRRRGELAVAVRDTGVGIAPEHQARIFDRLYRVDDTRDRTTGGSGLGLAIAQRAARALGGRIELESVPGRGSEFRLLLAGARARRGRPRERAPQRVPYG